MLKINETVNSTNIKKILDYLKAMPSPYLSDGASLGNAFNTATSKPSYPVPQGSYGISSGALLATEHVANCVAVILRDPVTKKTVLVHYDAHTSPSSLSAIIRSVKSDTLEATLVGARYIEKPNSDYYKTTSESNLIDVLNALRETGVPIVSALVPNTGPESDEHKYHAITIDPLTGSITVMPPTIADPDQSLIFGARYISKEKLSLQCAYDLDKNYERQPQKLTPTIAKFLDELDKYSIGKEDEEIKIWLTSKSINSDAYENVIKPLLEAFQLEKIHLSSGEQSGIPMYLGQNAKAFHQKLANSEALSSSNLPELKSFSP